MISINFRKSCLYETPFWREPETIIVVLLSCPKNTRSIDVRDMNLQEKKCALCDWRELQIDEDNKTYKEIKQRNKKDAKEDGYIPSDISRKILNMAHDQQVLYILIFIMEQMELDDDIMDAEANQEEDFHFKISNMDDDDDMVDLSSDEGETEEFIKDYNISAEDDVHSKFDCL